MIAFARPFGFWILGFGMCLIAQDTHVLDDMIKPLYFETLNYPLTARLNHVQGAVVVRATLDDQGNVVFSEAMSGAKSLIPDCLSNSKRWRFQSNREKTTVIVYRFKIEGLCNLPCPSHFHLQPPNLATITIGEPVVDHSAK